MGTANTVSAHEAGAEALTGEPLGLKQEPQELFPGDRAADRVTELRPPNPELLRHPADHEVWDLATTRAMGDVGDAHDLSFVNALEGGVTLRPILIEPELPRQRLTNHPRREWHLSTGKQGLEIPELSLQPGVEGLPAIP